MKKALLVVLISALAVAMGCQTAVTDGDDAVSSQPEVAEAGEENPSETKWSKAAEEVSRLARERVSDEDFSGYQETKAFPDVDVAGIAAIRVAYYPNSVDVTDEETIRAIMAAINDLEFTFSGDTLYGHYGEGFGIKLLDKDQNELGYDLCVAAKNWMDDECFFYDAHEWAAENRMYPPIYHVKNKDVLYEILSTLIPTPFNDL